VDAAVSAADRAQKIFQDQGLESRRAVIEALRKASIANAERWGAMAVRETKMGRADDKTRKNLLCATRTPGVEDLETRAYTGDKGLTLVEFAPFGVVAAVTPSNNPAATIISNAIGILAAGNSVIFAPHPAAAKVCRDAMRIPCGGGGLGRGAPAGLIATVAPRLSGNGEGPPGSSRGPLEHGDGRPFDRESGHDDGQDLQDHSGRAGQPSGGRGRDGRFPQVRPGHYLRGELRQ
jgi:delta 1-pyrroline-5-carboxylate dehydrogenase